MTATLPRVHPAPFPAAAGGRLLGLVVDLPDRLLAAGLAACVVVSALVVTQAFRAALVLPLVAVAALLVQLVRLPSMRPTRRDAAVVVVVLVGVTAWVVANLPYRAEDVFVARDPGNYTLTALWMVDHASPRIALGAGSGSTQGFDAVDGAWQPHGLHLLPALAAAGGWAAGQEGVLRAGLVIGSFALLAVFALARRLCGSAWALLPVTGLALSLPFLHVARSMYTEPLAVALTGTGAAALVAALRTPSSGAAWGLSGAALGAVSLTRIDGTLPLLGSTAAVAVLALLAADAERLRMAVGLRLHATCALPLVALGLADGWVNSRPYLLAHAGRVLALALLLVALVAVAVALSARPPAVLRRAAGVVLGARGSLVLAGALGLAVVVLLTRPWWFVSRAATAPHPHREALQAAAGVPVDGLRTYDELSLTWLSWYWGWPCVLTGLAGLVAMAGWGLRARVWPPVGFAALVVPSLLLYSVRVSIFPDQVWAVRRFLPVVLPGLLVAAAWLLARAWTRRLLRLPSLLLAGLVVAWPVTTLPGLWSTVEWDGRAAGVERLCAQVPDGPVVSAGPLNAAATLRVLCGVEVVVVEEADASALADAARRGGGAPLPLVTAVPGSVPWRGGAPPPAVTVTSTRWEQVLLRRPVRLERLDLELTLGSVGADGVVSPR